MGELVDVDLEHLRLLKLSYYLLAGTLSLIALFSLIYLALGGLFASGLFPSTGVSDDDPRMVGLIFLGVGFGLFLFAVLIAFVNYWTGRCLRDRRHRIFCLDSVVTR